MLKVGIFVRQIKYTKNELERTAKSWDSVILKTFVMDNGFDVGDICVCTNDDRAFDALSELARSFSRRRIEAIIVTFGDGQFLEPFLNDDGSITIGRQRIPVIIMPKTYKNQYKGRYRFYFENCRKQFH